MKTRIILILVCVLFISNICIAQNNDLQFHNISTDNAIYNNTAALNPTDIITIEAWINAGSWRANIHEGSICGKDDWSAGNSGYMLRCGEGGDLSFVISVAGTWREARTTSNPMVTGTWYHVAGVFDGSNVKIYINGSEVASTSAFGAISTNSVNMQIGNCPADNNRYFDGFIDEVRLWHAALDQGVISAWMNKTVTSCHPDYANAIAYFELDDNSPSTKMWETIAGNDNNTSVSGASYGASTNAGFLGSVTGFQSTTASQPNTGSVSVGTTNSEIIRIEVEVYSVVNATEFRIRTDGTTNISDISNAKLWYTGTSSIFSTTSQFGATVASPLGAGIDMVFSGLQSLSCGTNYFWLSYDVNGGATLGNVIDGLYQSSIIDGISRTPVTSAPAGSRTIANTCSHSIDLTDTFGDGWNGGTVTVSVNGTPVLTNIGLAAGLGPDTYNFNAASGDIINVTCTNQGSYYSEMRVEVFDGISATIIALQQPPVAPGANGNGSCAVAPMTYVSSIASQPTITDVSPSTTDQEVIRIEVVTTGSASPIDATEIRVRTNGTTNVTDIANAKLWYTGTSATYATTTQFGSTVAIPPAPGADMTFSATQTLAEGTNYFWLSYDVTGGATIGNVIDGRFHSVIVGGSNYTPTTAEPAGSRTISINYCSSNATSTSDEEIYNVTIGTLNNTSDCVTTGGGSSILNEYSDFTAVASPTLTHGVSYPFSVEIGTCGGNYSNSTRIYIDYNQNGLFTDPGEDVYMSASATSGPHFETGNITIPVTATLGNTRMRVICVETSTPSSISSCGTYSWGETEDYTVTIGSAGPMVFSSCTASQPNTDDVSIGATNQEVIQLEVVTSGTLNPIDATDFRVRTNGTTDYTTDIINAKMWFTGTSSTFATTNPFGTTVASPPAPGTNMIFTGNQTLETGTNYFWLTYDVPATATDGNFIDGFFRRVTVDGVSYFPITSAPAGDRLIIDGCHYTLTLHDSGGNGWNGGTITVQVNGVDVLTAVTLAAGSSGTFDFVADDGDAITTIYSAGTNPGENRYVITNPNDAYILSDGHDSDIPTAGVAGTGDCSAVPDFTNNGDAYQTATNCFILTEDKMDESGSVWYNYKVDLTSNFLIRFNYYLGDKDITMVNAGADGAVFSLQGECSASGGNGGDLGYGGITPSVAIEFDTYQNIVPNNDPVDDHIALVSNGSVNHGAATNLAGPTSVAAGFEDDAWHPVAVRWFSATNTLEVYFDAVLVISYTGDIINNIFGGDPIVFWGFTGGTGLYFNRQEVCVTTFPGNSSALSDIYCDPCNEQVEVATGATSYTWTPNDGSIDDPTINNPTLTPTTTTEYTVLIEDACGNLITDAFTVYVGTLPTELFSFEGKCKGGQNTLSWITLSETNNDYFVIEKSYNGLTYMESGLVKGNGTSNSEIEYSWVDNEMKDAYYRLKQIDYDGNIAYSEAIYINCQDKDKIQVYPNPASNVLNIDVKTPGRENVTIKLSDPPGKIVYSENFMLENHSIFKSININHYQYGIYYLMIIDNNSNQIIHTEKVILRN